MDRCPVTQRANPPLLCPCVLSRKCQGLSGVNVHTAANAQAATNSASIRKPSATLAFVVMSQIQFLATLSLVDYTVEENSWLSDFSSGLR